MSTDTNNCTRDRNSSAAMCDQGKEYANFIEAELQSQYEQRDAVNDRANKALTGCAGLVTLVLAVFAVLLGKDFTLDGEARRWLLVALYCLLGAAFFAVMAGLPWKLKFTETTTLRKMLSADHWGDDEIDARYITAKCRVEVLDSLRGGTTAKAVSLVASGVLQLVAVVALIGCTLAVVDTAHPSTENHGPTAPSAPPQLPTPTP